MLKGWLSRFSRKPALSGAPAVRRMKSYSAQSGYVYQYYYDGQRAGEAHGETGTEYVFQVSADRKTWRAASVLVGTDSLRTWESGHGRQLAGTECYAIAKMALFQAFDERASPSQMGVLVRVRAADVESIVAALGLE